MITLHSVSKELGRGRQRTLVLDEIDLVIPVRARLVILGQIGSGKTTLLNLLNGGLLPTRGWIERRAIVSAPLGLSRHAAGPMTIRQLTHRLASLYKADELELSHFVSQFGDLDDVMDVPLRKLTAVIRTRLNQALFYGLPCDYYLFDNAFTVRAKELERKVREAFNRRSRNSGMILATSKSTVAREFGGEGCILFGGKLIFFNSLRNAISAYEKLQVEHPVNAPDKTQLKVSERGPSSVFEPVDS